MIAKWDMQKLEGEEKSTSRVNGSQGDVLGMLVFWVFLVFRDCLARPEGETG